ncbi:amidase [Rhizobium sp. BK650]|uniref:amidase n=1 Tax=Rhizobium sp. BK650 TaxID=2586990 RepID=UPI0016202B7C|nr:amidase family protein [Rhizobium sp. BK650]MBB3660729.1 amidase [Rhizobium sp. BK650]
MPFLLSNDMDLPLIDIDATAQAELVRRGSLTAGDLLDAAIARYQALNPILNAVASFDPEKASQRLHRTLSGSVFEGVPTLLKDLLAYPGLPASFGSRLLAGYVPAAGSPYTDAIDAAGLVVIGKSTTSEFGLLGTTESMATGQTRNPWDLSRSTGGSSGGAAAAVASGMFPVAHASDGGGSIRGPASLCGVFGFKPGRGKTRSTGMPDDAPLSALLSDHCLSRTVRDSATWLRVTEKEGITNPLADAAELAADLPGSLRIGWFERDCFGHLPDPDVRIALRATVKLCESLSHRLMPIDGPRLDRAEPGGAILDLMAATTAHLTGMVAPNLTPTQSEQSLEPYTRWLVKRGRGIAPFRIGEAMETMATFGHDFKKLLEGFDVLLSPTIPFTAFPLGEFAPGTDNEILRLHFERSAAFTALASMAGFPAMSVPLQVSEGGLPIGSHFVVREGDEALLLRLAFQLEAAAPWLPRLRELSRRLAWRKS